MADKLFIAVAGNIGTGKTTLTSLLADHFHWKAYYESVEDNPYLEDFYGDMKSHSFQLQMFFLANRFKVHNEITIGTASAIQDRSIYEDGHIFARNLFDSGRMEKRDYENYLSHYKMMIPYLSAPDLILYLRKDVDRLMEQIELRGRPFEANIEREYLTHLNQYYEDWIEKYSDGKVLVVDSNELDFVKNKSDFQYIADQIFETLDQRELFVVR